MPYEKAKEQLWKDYSKKKTKIRKRLEEFKRNGKASDREIFEELAFCILTANASAKMGMRSIDAIKNIIHEGTAEEISKAIKGRHRFWRIRPAFIFETREFIKKEFNSNMKQMLSSFDDPYKLRDFLATSKGIKGIGYKESSHFLRNIGHKGYAILDKHIINCLHEFGVIDENIRPSKKSTYLETESKMQNFSKAVDIDIDELDLLLWSRQTGEILK